MESKYTKGEWTASINPIDTVNHDDAGTVWCDKKEGSTLICSTSKSPGLEEGQANAKLIAAAPELLEALKDLLVVYKDATQTVPRHYDLVDQVEAAILKATSI